jgi:hypothetical protein
MAGSSVLVPSVIPRVPGSVWVAGVAAQRVGEAEATDADGLEGADLDAAVAASPVRSNTGT